MSDNLDTLVEYQRHITDNFAAIQSNVSGVERLDFMVNMYWGFEDGRFNCDAGEDTSIYEASAVTVKTWIDANGGFPADGPLALRSVDPTPSSPTA